MKKIIFLFILPGLLANCAIRRSADSGYSNQDPTQTSGLNDGKLSSSERQTAYELGFDPNRGLSYDEMVAVRQRHKVRELERQLNSKKEKEQYSKVLPWLRSDEEKISLLSIPSLEGRQQWINNRRIWQRAQAPDMEVKQLIESGDISVGMPQDYVRRAWGEPSAIDVSGNPIYKNERWRYIKMVSGSEGYRKETRTVYFEGGRVVGWETDNN